MYTNTNEDVGFNTQCHLIANCVDERIKQIDQTTYIQLQNPNSLTRQNNNEFVHKKKFLRDLLWIRYMPTNMH